MTTKFIWFGILLWAASDASVKPWFECKLVIQGPQGNNHNLRGCFTRQNEDYTNLAGFIQRGRDDEGTVPVELNTTDFSSVTCETVHFAGRDRQNTNSITLSEKPRPIHSEFLQLFKNLNLHKLRSMRVESLTFTKICIFLQTSLNQDIYLLQTEIDSN